MNQLVKEAPYHPGYEDAVITPTNEMTPAQLIEALDNRYGNPLAPDCALIQEAIKVLQFQSEEIAACYQHIKELQEK